MYHVFMKAQTNNIIQWRKYEIINMQHIEYSEQAIICGEKFQAISGMTILGLFPRKDD